MVTPNARSAPPSQTLHSHNQPASQQSSPPHHRQGFVNSRSLANPHSSGDTQPMDDIAVQYEPIHNVRSESQVNGNHLPIRSTPTPAPSSVPDTQSQIAADNSIDILGSGVKVLLHAIRDLERHGIDTAASVPLPKIVVVGDQSAGKSSLIEAISEITVPRDSGTCTRCVLHINLRDEPHSQWRCEVSLVKKYAFLPHLREEPLYPWAETEQQISPFSTVYQKSDLEAMIRMAQLATLNPKDDPRIYAKGNITSQAQTQVPFSPNIISLEIVAPGLPNLSFYDLPGIISQSQDGRKDTVHLIKSLAQTYISQENTIILLTVPMESDIDNSMASALVDDAGANDRTIGVLTKPDRLQSSDRVDVWKSVLQGQNFCKGHGYFVVKQPGQMDLAGGITHAEARIQEEKFFGSSTWTSRFGSIDVHDRLGTRNLQRDLSNKLAQLILEVMPSLEAKVTRKHAEVEDELAELPEPPPNALQVVNRAITDFAQAFRIKIDGTEPNDLSESWKRIKNQFHETIIVGQRPTLMIISPEDELASFKSPTPTPKSKTSPNKRDLHVIDLSSDEEEITTPSKKRKGANGAPRKTTRPAKREGSISSIAPVSRDPLRKVFKLDDLRDTLDSYSTSGLPSVVELKAVDYMILETLTHWKTPLDTLITGLSNALAQALKTTLSVRIREWRETKLFDEMHEANLKFMNNHMEFMKNTVYRALAIERVKPITRDEKLMERYVTEETVELEAARLRRRHKEYADGILDTNNKDISIKSWDDKAKRLALETLGADPYSREVGVMARIRAYYQIASMRFVDQVVQAVEAELFVKFRDLDNDLVQELRVLEEDAFKNANRLVADDPDREERRAILKERKERLEQAGERLREMNHTLYQQHPGLLV